MKKNLKLSLLIKFKDVKPNFVISPEPTQLSENDYELIVTSKEIFKFSVTVTDIKPGSALIIDKITLNNVEFNHLDSFGIYKTANGIKQTYGYMDELGTYTFKIRYNPLSHHYLHYLLDSAT